MEEKRVSATIGAAEMLLKGCTACYDLFVEFPLPTEEGIAAVADAYAQAGMRAVIAPMMADMTLYEAIPGLMDALPPHLQQAVAPLGLPPWQKTLRTTCARSCAIGARIARWCGPRSRRPSRCIAAMSS